MKRSPSTACSLKTAGQTPNAEKRTAQSNRWASSMGQRTNPLTSSAAPTDSNSENNDYLRPMVLSITAKVETQGT